MDKIYSRKRIRVFKYSANHKKSNEKRRKILRISAIMTIAIITLYTLLKSINPIFEGLCVAKARILSVDIINRKTSEVLSKYQYKDIVQVIHNEEDETNILKTDVVTINQIISDISVEILKELKSMEGEEVKIHLGAFTGNRYFSGVGPSIGIKLVQTGSVTTDVKTEFESIGINQSVYRVYMDITCNMNILTPYKTISHQSNNKVLLVETVIVGGVPETYYNLEGVTKDDTMNMM